MLGQQIGMPAQAVARAVDLDADEMEFFELAWDAEAPARCRGCKAPIPMCAWGTASALPSARLALRAALHSH